MKFMHKARAEKELLSLQNVTMMLHSLMTKATAEFSLIRYLDGKNFPMINGNLKI